MHHIDAEKRRLRRSHLHIPRDPATHGLCGRAPAPFQSAAKAAKAKGPCANCQWLVKLQPKRREAEEQHARKVAHLRAVGHTIEKITATRYRVTYLVGDTIKTKRTPLLFSDASAQVWARLFLQAKK